MHYNSSEQDIQKAMDACASEPVHIPGIVQPFGCLIGVDRTKQRVLYASENCFEILGLTASALLETSIVQTLGHEIAHALNNAAARADFDQKLTPVGLFTLNGNDIEISAFDSDGICVLQFEREKDPELDGGDALRTLAFLMKEVQACRDHQSLFEMTANLLRYFTGYDRVTVNKFDPQYNGEVVAEAKQHSLETFAGLRFPQWDIPVQAREIMAKLPLRFIEDVQQVPISIRAASPTLRPLDITLASCRGVSSVHMEYLKNMGVKATMTLSVVIEGMLWGFISFHHRQTRVLAPKKREILIAFVGLFSTKLQALNKQSQYDLVRKIDKIKDDILKEIDSDEIMEEAMPRIGPVLKEVLQADGVALLAGSQATNHGRVPEQEVLTQLFKETQAQVGTSIISNSLAAKYPQFLDSLNGCAGVFASAITPQRALCIFRSEETQSVSWAGNPQKTIEHVSGAARLAPRASFSSYLQDIEGCSAVWSDEDIYFAERIWVLVNSAERRALKNTLNRQQALMIKELNHRVRNILALVKSVSRQTRQRYDSVRDYSISLENRIQALAAAHDIASESALFSIDIRHIIEISLAPYHEHNMIYVSGPSRLLRAEIAPIFSLVLHELATNAAKYGALTVKEGTISVQIADEDGGVCVKWKEEHGPVVVPPSDQGFGSVLINEAVPHELGGKADLRYPPTGVEADFFLPETVLDTATSVVTQSVLQEKNVQSETLSTSYDSKQIDGVVLLLEDNFVIANDMKNQLADSGICNVEVFSNLDDAFEAVDMALPAFALLDVHLGSGKSSAPLAQHLLEQNIPFIFVTGYGDQAPLDEQFQFIPCLTKPAQTHDLQAAISKAFDL
ncbi:MAG: HWE histidine kinase domain-containing protein [Roseobacter sp.]